MSQDLAKSFDLKEPKGALVGNVAEESPAEQAGLKSGDVIVGYRGLPIDDAVTLQRQVTRTPVGTKAPVQVVRNGKSLDLTVTVGEQPGLVKTAGAERSQDHALAGLDIQSLDPKTARDLGLSAKTKGVLVVGVDPDSGAAKAGLAQGDVIREINKQPIASVQEFEKIAAGLKKDQPVLMLVNRHGASLFISVKI